MTSADRFQYRPYSSVWFRTFLDTIDAAQTAREVEFIQTLLPRDRYPRMLDLCCGPGRHAIPLAHRGFDVTGIDFDDAAIAAARAAASGAAFLHSDVRALDGIAGAWDAALIMWASFGYFAAHENRALLDAIRARLRPRGRLLLDIYNRDFFVAHQGVRRGERAGVMYTETRSVDGDRLTVQLTYDGHDAADQFSWQIFEPAAITTLLDSAGFSTRLLCAAFDSGRAVTAADARMQVVAERAAPGAAARPARP
ncbi:MAG TPA: class I SAM-dependent methyltransferase [Longimicrobiales bacterium]|nr:class I SAM-dependent methyltransferase [Longimicrobiales bacterium]